MTQREAARLARQFGEPAQPLCVVAALHIAILVIAGKQRRRRIDNDQAEVANGLKLALDERQFAIEPLHQLPRIAGDEHIELCAVEPHAMHQANHAHLHVGLVLCRNVQDAARFDLVGSELLAPDGVCDQHRKPRRNARLPGSRLPGQRIERPRCTTPSTR